MPKIIVGISLLIIILLSLLYLYRKNEHHRNIKELSILLDSLNRDFKPSVIYIPYPIFYINMDKDTDRRAYMEEQLNKMNCTFSRISGIIGKSITNTNEDTIQGIHFRNTYPLTKSEIGCLLSHIKAIEYAYLSKAPVAMICEDDVYFGTLSKVPNLARIIDNAPSDWELLQIFSGIQDEREYKRHNKTSNLAYIKRRWPDSIFWACGCYIINRKGMESILSYVKRDGIYDIRPNRNLYPSRGEADLFLLDLANTYTILPSLVSVNNLQNESTIHAEHTPQHIKVALFSLKKIMSL
jgi:GR25 family glycosyltransferase involved in LPS biosynthesis